MLVGFVLKRNKPEAEVIARELFPWLKEGGHGVLVLGEQAHLAGDGVEVVEGDAMGQRAGLVVVLGGDGTLLQGASIVGGHRVPVLGVNLGTLGFLVPFAPAEARVALGRALAGELPLEERMRIAVRLHHADGQLTERFALNDAVLSQGSMARLVELGCRLDGKLVAQYKADGLIVSTPTGSTAYNLAAGGPILYPGQSAVAITPICPHTLTHRPLVVPASSRVEVQVGGDSRSIMLTVDGQWAYPLAPGDRVEMSQAEAPLRLYHSEKSYFEILREKLSWGSRG